MGAYSWPGLTVCPLSTTPSGMGTSEKKTPTNSDEGVLLSLWVMRWAWLTLMTPLSSTG